MIAGILLWLRTFKPLIGKSLNLRNGMLPMVAVIGADIIAGCYGIWFLGEVLLAMGILLWVANINLPGTGDNFNRI